MSFSSQAELNFETNFKAVSEAMANTIKIKQQALQFYHLNKGKVLTSLDLEHIHQSVVEYKKNIDVINKQIEDYEFLVDQKVKFKVYDKKSLIEDPLLSEWEYDHFPKAVRNRHENKRRKIFLNPKEDYSKELILNIKLAYASALVLFDNFSDTLILFQRNKDFRRTINYDNVELEGILEHISDAYYNLYNLNKLKKARKLFNKIHRWENKNPNSQQALNGYNVYLNEIILDSLGHEKLRNLNTPKALVNWLKQKWKNRRDDLFVLQATSTNTLSYLFGNAVGMVQTRSGRLSNVDQTARDTIKKDLKPLDILLEKTPFRLTDKFIPGHWGHVAIWTGNEKQLKELGVWSELDEIHEYIKEYHGYKGKSLKQHIRDGNMVLEALRPGVELNPLKHFLNVDDLAVLRTRESIPLEEQKEMLLKAFHQVGKDYDFNFDVQTDKKIVCSELAYVVYDSYDWPIQKQLGRFTISPDHVASKAKKSEIFKPVMIYHDGKRIEKRLQKNFNLLLMQKYQLLDL